MYHPFQLRMQSCLDFVWEKEKKRIFKFLQPLTARVKTYHLHPPTACTQIFKIWKRHFSSLRTVSLGLKDDTKYRRCKLINTDAMCQNLFSIHNSLCRCTSFIQHRSITSPCVSRYLKKTTLFPCCWIGSNSTTVLDNMDRASICHSERKK